MKRARKAKGLTAKELGERAGVSLNYIQRIEGGSRALTPQLQSKIESALGFTKEEFPFNFEELIQECERLIEENGKAAKCGLGYGFIDGRIFFTSIGLDNNGLTTSLECGKLLLEFQLWALE